MQDCKFKKQTQKFYVRERLFETLLVEAADH
jgi:hypothetical protein